MIRLGKWATFIDTRRSSAAPQGTHQPASHIFVEKLPNMV